jgi:hypothetical protein
LILIKSWSRGIQEAKQHIYRAMQESREGQDENNPIMRLRQQHATSQSSSSNNNNTTAAAENSYGAYPREKKHDDDGEEDLYDDADDGGDSGSFNDDDDGVGPWGGMDRQKSDLSADTMSSLTFHEAVNEIKSLTSAPLQPESLKYCVT